MQEQLITVDNRLTLAEAGRLVNVGPTAVFRWIREGRNGVKLDHARLGRRMYTSAPALTKFMNESARQESIAV